MENCFVFYFFNYLHLTRKLHALLSTHITHISTSTLTVFYLIGYSQIFFKIFSSFTIKTIKTLEVIKNGEPF
jgi:hypothetical protein